MLVVTVAVRFDECRVWRGRVDAVGLAPDEVGEVVGDEWNFFSRAATRKGSSILLSGLHRFVPGKWNVS